MKRVVDRFRLYAAALLSAATLAAGCSDKDPVAAYEPPVREPQLVTVLLEECYSLEYEGELTLRGLGFAEGDVVLMREGEHEAQEGAEEHALAIERITRTDITLRIPAGIESGVWSLYCRREAQTQYLGSPRLEVADYVIARGVRLGERYTLDRLDRMRIEGEGFREGDAVEFVREGAHDPLPASDPVPEEGAIAFRIPEELTDGRWEIWAARGEHRQLLGVTELKVLPFPWIDPLTLPEGTTLYGRVYAGDRPLAGAIVSDGLHLARTDERGVWALASDRAEGTVFVSLPRGYEAPVEGCVPRFWHLLEEGVDRYDFPLEATGTDDYVLLVTADIQIDNSVRRMVPQSSLASCTGSFVPDFHATIARMGGRKVYAVSLGDMVWDQFWYTQHFALPEYKELISGFGVPFFHIMGNHDNDPYRADDHAAAEAYRRHLGPTYYSLNLGRIHFVALDNVQYVNTGASQGVVGDCSYRSGLTDRQIEWLRADLAAVEDKSAPLVVWMHVPLTNGRLLAPTGNMSGHAAFAALFDGFSDVRVLSGHHHNNHHSVYPSHPHIAEHNVGSVCGSLWYNVKGFNGANQPFGAATDGTPTGYAVYEIEGERIAWRYKGCDVDADVQFTAYDMNRLDARFKDRTVENELLVNVWDWDDAWRVEVFEAGSPLAVERQLRKDPNYLRYVEEVYIPSGDAVSKAAAKAQSTPHMFSAVTHAADSEVTVRVTDRFGRVYEKRVR